MMDDNDGYADWEAEIREEWTNVAEAVPEDVRERFMAGIRSGMPIGEVRRFLGLTFEEMLGVVNMNIDEVRTLFRRREAR